MSMTLYSGAPLRRRCSGTHLLPNNCPPYRCPLVRERASNALMVVRYVLAKNFISSEEDILSRVSYKRVSTVYKVLTDYSSKANYHVRKRFLDKILKAFFFLSFDVSESLCKSQNWDCWSKSKLTLRFILLSGRQYLSPDMDTSLNCMLSTICVHATIIN